MNTKGIQFLAVLAVFAMAFASFAVIGTDIDAVKEGSKPVETDTAANIVIGEITGAAGAATGTTYFDLSGQTTKTTITVNGTAADEDVILYILPGSQQFVVTVGVTQVPKSIQIFVAKSFSPATGGTTGTVTYYSDLAVKFTKSEMALSGSATLTLNAGADETGPTAKVTLADGANLPMGDSTFGAEYIEKVTSGNATTTVYNFYAQGATLSDIVLKATGESAVVRDAKVTVKQNAGTTVDGPIAGSVTFTGLTSVEGIDLQYKSTSSMEITGTVVANNENYITIGGRVSTGFNGLVFADASIPSINACTTVGFDINTHKFNTAFVGSDAGELDMSSYHYAYGKVDVSMKATGSTGYTFHLVNSTGTISFNSTDTKYNLSIRTEGFTGRFVPSALPLTYLTMYYTSGSIMLEKGDFRAAEVTLNGNLSIASNAILKTTGNTTITGNLLLRGILELGGSLSITGNADVYGTIKSSDTASVRTITVNASTDKAEDAVKFIAKTGSSLIYVNVVAGTHPDNVTIDLSAATSTVYLHGTISTSQTFGQTQNVVVDGDLEIKDGAVITIKGGFQVNEGVKMTITSGKVNVVGAGVDVVIDGDLDIGTNGTLTVEDTAKSVKINGTVENDGTMTIKTTNVVVAAGGEMTITDTSKGTTLSGITIAAAGHLQINGNISETTITNNGSVVFNGAVLNGHVRVLMNGNGASVVITSATNATDGTAHSITITDDGMTAPVKGYEPVYENQITIYTTTAVAKYGFGGVTVTQSVTANDKTSKFSSKFTVSGSLGVIGDTAMAKMTMDAASASGKANFAFADGFTVGPGATLDVNYLTPVDNTMYVIGAAGETKKATLTGKLVVNGVIEANSYTEIDSDKFSAASFTVGLGTDAVKYYASIENAVEILEDYTDPIALTILGSDLVVKSSVTIPANISLKGAATFTIGSDSDNTVVMYVTSGSSIGSDLSIIVKGTLYLENAKDLKTSKVTADVKTTDGTDLNYTNLYTALSLAEAGNRIEVTTDDLTIIKSIIVPEDVTLYIPSGVTASVKVANKVTITVNGILMTDGIAGPFADKVSAEAAVLVVNGIFMTSETQDIAKVNEKYKAAGAYYFVSDDVGDFVYVSSLADGVMTTAKEFTIYGKVIESEDIILTERTVKLAAGSELFFASVSLGDSTIDATDGKLSARITGADGVSSLMVFDFESGKIKDAYNKTDKVNELSISAISGKVSIIEGTVFADVFVDSAADSAFIVSDGATFYIPDDVDVNLDSTAMIVGDIYVAGDLSIDSDDVIITGDITVLSDPETGISGELSVAKMSFVSGVITVMDGAEFELYGTITAGIEPTELGAAAAIIGNVTAYDEAIIAYPGADMSGMTINNKEPLSTEFYINDELFMTAYSSSTKTATILSVIGVPEYDLPDYKVPEKIGEDVTLWGASANSKVGDYVALYIELDLQDVDITTSWVNGLALYIDGARIMSATSTLTVGIHTVSASVNAGYACDNMTITFNGTALPVTKEGTVVTITIDDEGSILAVSGDVYIPEPEPVTPEEKSEWTVTTILLVILVILIAIMAVIVALRLNRS